MGVQMRLTRHAGLDPASRPKSPPPGSCPGQAPGGLLFDWIPIRNSELVAGIGFKLRGDDSIPDIEVGGVFYT